MDVSLSALQACMHRHLHAAHVLLNEIAAFMYFNSKIHETKSALDKKLLNAKNTMKEVTDELEEMRLSSERAVERCVSAGADTAKLCEGSPVEDHLAKTRKRAQVIADRIKLVEKSLSGLELELSHSVKTTEAKIHELVKMSDEFVLLGSTIERTYGAAALKHAIESSCEVDTVMRMDGAMKAFTEKGLTAAGRAATLLFQDRNTKLIELLTSPLPDEVAGDKEKSDTAASEASGKAEPDAAVASEPEAKKAKEA